MSTALLADRIPGSPGIRSESPDGGERVGNRSASSRKCPSTEPGKIYDSKNGKDVKPWQIRFRRGQRLLARHQPKRSLTEFREALQICPVSERQDLRRIFLYLSIALRQLGLRGNALKSLLSAGKLQKRGRLSRKLRQRVNGYGMPVQDNRELDDWKAFLSIQMGKYLETKPNNRTGSRAEADMVRHLIMDYWKLLRATGQLRGRNEDEKRAIFNQIAVVFPFTDVPARLDDPVIRVDFSRKNVARPSDPCACRSGLPFKLCCGRIPGEDELRIGS